MRNDEIDVSGILGMDPTHSAFTPSSATIFAKVVRPLSCALVRNTSGGCVANVALPPAMAPAGTVSTGATARPTPTG